MLPLNGVRVLAVEQHGAGPFGTKAMQAGFDAFIIKALEERALKEALSGRD